MLKIPSLHLKSSLSEKPRDCLPCLFIIILLYLQSAYPKMFFTLIISQKCKLKQNWIMFHSPEYYMYLTMWLPVDWSYTVSSSIVLAILKFNLPEWPYPAARSLLTTQCFPNMPYSIMLMCLWTCSWTLKFSWNAFSHFLSQKAFSLLQSNLYVKPQLIII